MGLRAGGMKGSYRLCLGSVPLVRLVQLGLIHTTHCRKSEVCNVNICIALIARTAYQCLLFMEL